MTSFKLDKLQSNPTCAEQVDVKNCHKPAWKLTYEPRATPAEWLTSGRRVVGEWLASASKYHVTIIREEGSNGEMAAVMYAAGFEPWDVHMCDLLSGRITLEGFRGIVFVGGFSYADVLESVSGWAATILNSKELKAQFDAFYARPDTFSLALLGICNGCQWLPADGAAELRAVEGHRGGQAAALHPEQVAS